MAATTDELLHLTVDIDHPNCWTLQTTADTGAGLLGHGMVGGDGSGRQFGVYTAYGGSRATVDDLVGAIEDSGLTDRVTSVSPALPVGDGARAKASRDVLVAFDPGPSIRAAFADRGFLHCGPSVHENGRERRQFLAWADRPRLTEALAEIEAAYDADFEIVRVSPTDSTAADSGAESLTTRQREAFSLARERGYYEYPRRTTTRALAAELDISKTTYLEHLRKAEAKLLRSIDGP